LWSHIHEHEVVPTESEISDYLGLTDLQVRSCLDYLAKRGTIEFTSEDPNGILLLEPYDKAQQDRYFFEFKIAETLTRLGQLLHLAESGHSSSQDICIAIDDIADSLTQVCPEINGNYGVGPWVDARSLSGNFLSRKVC